MIFSAVSLGFLINIVPILIWLNFYLKRDYRKEPIFWVIIALLVGIGITPLVFASEVGLFGIFDGLINNNATSKSFLLSVLIAPFIEEVAKFLPVYFLIFRKKLVKIVSLLATEIFGLVRFRDFFLIFLRFFSRFEKKRDLGFFLKNLKNGNF